LFRDVSFHVPCDGFDPGGCVGRVDVVDDFVGAEEAEGVAEGFEGVDCGEDVLEVDCVVGISGVGAVDGVGGGVDLD